MKKLIIAIVIIVSISSLSIAQDCIIPSEIKSYDYNSTEAIANKKDWKNDIETDSWLFALSWSKGFCDRYSGDIPKRLEHQCLNNSMGLIIHGLWAQSNKAGGDYKKHPRNCTDAEAIDSTLIENYICIIPGIKLMQKEWEKHGTCDFDTAEEYFATMNVLYQQLNIPSKEDLEVYEFKSPEIIKAYFLSINKDIGLNKNNVVIKINNKNKRLSEIYILYDKHFRFLKTDN
jgi:ribonuclease T2